MVKIEEWPAHFPSECPANETEHAGAKCPPDDAVPLGGVLFVFAHEPVAADDFRSALERKAFDRECVCQRASQSCWTNRQSAEDIRKTLPTKRNAVVKSATFGPSDGVMKPTTKHAAAGHRSVWFSKATHATLAARFKP